MARVLGYNHRVRFLSSCARPPLVLALLCLLTALLLKATEPRPERASIAHHAQAGVRPAAVVPVPDRPRAGSAGRLGRARPGVIRTDGLWRVQETTAVEVVEDETPSAGLPHASSPVSGVFWGTPARRSAVGQGAASGVTVAPGRAGTPPHRSRHRRLARQVAADRRDDAAFRTNAASEAAPRVDTPSAGVPAATELPAGAAVAPVPADVAYQSADDEAFATDGRVAIPIASADERDERKTDKHDGGSVSLWVQPGWERGNRDDATLVQVDETVRVSKNGHVLKLEAAGTDADVDVPIADWNPGEWHHVAATWDGDGVALYVDGELAGRRVGQGPRDQPPEAAVVIGSSTDDERPVARGLIGKVDVRNRPLDATEVADNYLAMVDGSGTDTNGNGRARGHEDATAGDRGRGHDDTTPEEHGRGHEPDRGRTADTRLARR